MGSNGVAPGQVRRDLAKHHAEQETTLAKLIGETVAVHLAQMLGQLLPQMPWQPECFWCVTAASQTVRDYQVRVTNAQAAGETNPEPPPAPQVAKSVTLVPVTQMAQTPAGPVPVSVALPACFGHVPVPQDMPKPTGLVMPDGRPIVRGAGGQPHRAP
jgi:bacterioferritin-associated ferredoxin